MKKMIFMGIASSLVVLMAGCARDYPTAYQARVVSPVVVPTVASGCHRYCHRTPCYRRHVHHVNGHTVVHTN